MTKDRKNISNRIATMAFTILMMAIALAVNVAIRIAKYPERDINAEETYQISFEQEEKPEVKQKTTGNQMVERVFTLKNDDESIDEIVPLKELLGTTPFVEGTYQCEIPLEDRKRLREEGVKEFEISLEDRKLLERLVFAEAGTTEGLKGQVAIAAEVLNRLYSPDFPNTIPEVLSQENQYYPDGISYWTDPEGISRPVYDSDIPEKTKFAVDLALSGADPTELKLGGTGAFYHYNPELSRGDGKEYIIDQMKIGNHMFYRNQDGLPGHTEMVP